MDFSGFIVRKCPAAAMYIPNFLTFEEEQSLLSQIERAPKPKWTQLRNRRLINYGGIPHPKGMIAEEIPEWLRMYVDKVSNLGIFESQRANHVLVNEYKPGQGIMPHTDGPLFYPTISTISCGSHTLLEFMEREKPTEDTLPIPTDEDLSDNNSSAQKREVLFKLLLEPRSLLILKDLLYTDYLHSISECSSDVLCDRICNYENCENSYKVGDCLERKTRISFTIRNVPRTTKMKLKFC